MSRIGRYTYNPEDVQAKYETENRRGAQQWALGTVPTYPTRQSFPRGWTEDFSSAFIFDRASEKRIAIEMTHPFMTLEKTTRIALWMAGRDFPLHASLLNGFAENMSEEARARLYHKLTVDQDIEQAKKRVELTKDLVFTHLLITPGGITLNCRAIPPAIVVYRDTLEAALKTHGLQLRGGAPRPMENILHCTLARWKTFPDKNSPQRARYLSTFLVGMHQLRAHLLTHPVTLTTSHVHLGESIMGMEQASLATA